MSTVNESKSKENGEPSGMEKKAIELLGDTYSCDILKETSKRPLPIKEISEEAGVPLTTTYRRVEDLVDAGLLRRKTDFSEGGKHRDVYTTDLRAVEVKFDEGEIEIDCRYGDR
ncbi:MAG: winged helix-turn-helix domain-containing protein [Halobacteria archaeon]|nr:winged helix-turn-helix domain-containing protein [Halobacteria archaeon]